MKHRPSGPKHPLDKVHQLREKLKPSATISKNPKSLKNKAPNNPPANTRPPRNRPTHQSPLRPLPHRKNLPQLLMVPKYPLISLNHPRQVRILRFHRRHAGLGLAGINATCFEAVERVPRVKKVYLAFGEGFRGFVERGTELLRQRVGGLFLLRRLGR